MLISLPRLVKELPGKCILWKAVKENGQNKERETRVVADGVCFPNTQPCVPSPHSGPIVREDLHNCSDRCHHFPAATRPWQLWEAVCQHLLQTKTIFLTHQACLLFSMFNTIMFCLFVCFECFGFQSWKGEAQMKWNGGGVPYKLPWELGCPPRLAVNNLLQKP